MLNDNENSTGMELEAAPPSEEAPARESARTGGDEPSAGNEGTITAGAPGEPEDEPAEVSLEGRRVQLEKKIAEETGEARTEPPAASPVPASGGVYGDPAPGANKKPRISKQAKAFYTVIIGLTVVMIGLFVFECYRRYQETGGLINGTINNFIDSDSIAVNPYSVNPGGSNDPHSSDTDREKPKKTESETSGERVKAPSAESAVNPAAAVLKAKDQPEDIDSADYTARNAYRKVKDAVVYVTVYSNASGVGDDTYKDGNGTGIIISSDGYIITNSHVVNDTKNVGVEILTNDNTTYEAVVVGFDTRTDLAVLKIDGKDLTAAEFVNSDQIEIGQLAFAVGNPAGKNYSNTLTGGLVSALNRTVPTSTLVSYIQTDAAINPGNSGGPLMNSAGQVMGVTTIKIASTDYEGMGFAIPSNTAIEIANSIISTGYVEGRVKLGVMAKSYASYDGANNVIKGIQIQEIMDDSSLKGSDKVQIGDVVTHIEGTATPDFSTWYTQLAKYEAGDTVTLTIYRPPTAGSASKTFDVDVKLVADNEND